MSRDDGKLKTKAQLRAEAVERLKQPRYENLSDYVYAILGWGYEPHQAKEAKAALIDLLTDDAHESRGSYEERLYDVPVSDCPYCGRERVVIHDFSDMYEKPHSYRVEHIDEKEAFNAGCFESYYAFDSVEKAVEHANMRDLLTDEEPRKFGVTAEQMAKASADFFDNLPSVNGKNGDSLPTTAEDEDANCKNGDSIQDSREKLKAADRVLSMLTGKGRVFGDECADERDSREKLEADIRAWRGKPDTIFDVIDGWLDRQAAITRIEVENEHADEILALNRHRGELQAKVDELEAENARLRSRMSDDAEYGRLVMGAYRELRAKLDEIAKVVDA